MMVLLRLLRGVFALFTLAGLIAGVPAALWLLGSPFLPDHIPSFDEIVVALTRPDDGSLLLGLLVLVGWVGWLQLAASIVIEAAALAGSLRWRRDVVGLRATRTLAALLIGWVITLAASPATASPVVPVAVSASFLPAPTGVQSNVPDAPPDGPVVIVAARDTLWDIAARSMGDPLRWREILDLNEGRRQADGGRLTDGAVLHVGWELRLPAGARIDADDAEARIRVKAGDSLSALAWHHLGDPARYPDLYDANRGVEQPDGRRLDDPDVIRPGWLLTVPGVVHPADEPDRLDPAPPVVTAPPPSVVVAPPAPEPAAPTRRSAQPSSPVARTDPATAPPPASTDNDITTAVPSSGLPAVIVVSGVAAGGVVAGLVLLRRRQTRSRRPGRQIALPDPELSRIEAATVSAARTAGTGFLDNALRSLAVLPRGYPQVQAVWLDPTGVDLVLGEPREADAPFVAEDDGMVWHVGADATLPIDEQDAVAVANPFPALVSVGTGGDGATLLIDVEHHGAIHLVGDESRAVDLLRNMVVELGTSRWADATRIVVVGLEPSLADLPPGRVVYVDDVRTAAGELKEAIRRTRQHLDLAGDHSVVDMRVQDQLSDSWVVTVLLVADPDTAHRDVLAQLCSELAQGARISAAIVTAGAPAGLPGTPVRVLPDGTVQIPDLDTGPLRAEQMSADLALGLLSVIGTTTAPDIPPPPATTPHPWAGGMLIDGSLQPDPRPPDPELVEDEADAAFSHVEVWELEPADHGPDPDPNPAARRRLLLVEQQDPGLDADLDVWQAEGPPPRPLIAILGEPAMRSPGAPPPKRHSWYLEVVVYLALHPLGVDRDKLTTDLWPEGSTVQPPTIRRAVAEARQWAGKDTSADPPVDFIPTISPAGGDRYRLSGHLTDWDLFRRLRKRAQARAAAGEHDGAVADYHAALSLVRGPVLHPLRQRGYEWLHNPDQRHDHLIPGFVIDTAHELVDLALDRGDIELARFAAETAQRVDPDRTSDRPFTDLMRIAHAAGDLAEMREHADLLLAERGFEVGEDLPPESFAVFNALLPHGLHAATG